MATTVDEGVQEVDIRNYLVNGLERRFENDSHTLIVEEFGLCQGDARIDLAVIDGALYGYEIKSDKDTLKRLERQLSIYEKVLDFVMLIVSPRHLVAAERMIPDWCGMCQVEGQSGSIIMTEIRAMRENRNVDASALVQLLWKDEAFDVLKCRDLHKGLANKSRHILWKSIAEHFSLGDIREEVRNRIKSRPRWRSGGRLRSCGD